MADWNDVYDELAANGYPISDKEKDAIVYNLSTEHNRTFDDIEWVRGPVSGEYIIIKFDWAERGLWLKKLHNTHEPVRADADIDGTLLQYAAYDGRLYKMMSIAERLRKRNTIVYGSGGFREYRIGLRTNVYCGTCHREVVYISATCSCAPLRAWREWERYHDNIALQHMWSESQWPHDAHAIAYNQEDWRHDRWVETFKSIMTTHLKQKRIVDKGTRSMVEEYINEAEHQDGDAYWLEFKQPDDVLVDFDLYCDNVEEDWSAHNSETRRGA